MAPSENPFRAALPAHPFDRLCWIMEKLLSPEGCPWDREQTHASLKQYLIEESYEVCDAIDRGDLEHLEEELGDVALQVVFHASLARKRGDFDVHDVLNGICEKLIRRHPHVFGDAVAETSDRVLENWEQIKKQEKQKDSLLDGVPRALPALQKAHRIQEKVRRVGFDWPDIHGALEKVREEFDELSVEMESHPSGPPTARQAEEMGDLLFSLVNIARIRGIQPEEALQAACDKFGKRFRHLERRATETGKNLQDMTLDEMDLWWEEAKALPPASA